MICNINIIDNKGNLHDFPEIEVDVIKNINVGAKKLRAGQGAAAVGAYGGNNDITFICKNFVTKYKEEGILQSIMKVYFICLDGTQYDIDTPTISFENEIIKFTSDKCNIVKNSN